MDFDTLLHPQTGIVAFIAYLWGNGTIARFIARLNQFLLLFSFVISFLIFIKNNPKRSGWILLNTILVLFSLYMIDYMFY